MAFARVSVRGLKEAIEGCEKRAARMKDLRVPMTEAGAEVARFAAERFNTATDGYGRPWKPLQPETVAHRKPGPPLQQSRNLLAQNYAVANPKGLTYGNRAPYAMYQYKTRGWFPNTPKGSAIRANGTPARRFFGRVREFILSYVIDGRVEK
jgi:hypothetical protein